MKELRPQTTNSRPWVLFALSLLVTLAALPVAGGFTTASLFAHMHWPGVAILLALAIFCLGCFGLCPNRPLIWKISTLVLAAHGLFWFLYAVGHRYLWHWYIS